MSRVDELEAMVRDLEWQADGYRNRIADLERELSSAKRERDGYEKSARMWGGEAGAAERKLDAMRDENERLRNRIADLERELGPARCTGVSARWCPVHGDCTCAEGKDYNDPTCPLHGAATAHGDRT